VEAKERKPPSKFGDEAKTKTGNKRQKTKARKKKEHRGLGWRQDNGNWSNQESKFDFLATRQCLVKIDRGTTKNKNRPHQPTIKFTGFLPINFLPLPAPPEAKAGKITNGSWGGGSKLVYLFICK